MTHGDSKNNFAVLVKTSAERTRKACGLYLISARKLSKLDKTKTAQLRIDELERMLEAADESQLEPYDALCGRFERSIEMILGKLFRSIEFFELGEGGQTLRDRLLFMEKLEMVESVEQWLEMRNVRNKIAHEYSAHDVATLYEQLIFEFPKNIEKVLAELDSYLKKRKLT